MTASTTRVRLTPAVLVLAAVGVVWSVLAGVQILVLNPLAAVPGRPLGQIYAELAAADETMQLPLVLLIAGLPAVAAIATLLLLRNETISADRGPVTLLGAIALGLPVYFLASFGPGMALADTYGIGGADHSPWGAVLASISAFAILLALVLKVRGPLDRRTRNVDVADAHR